MVKVFWLLVLLFPRLAFAEDAVVQDISDRRYLPKLIELTDQAQTSIDVSMYQILLPQGAGEDHPVSQILAFLARARARGVKVRVLLNRSSDDFPGTVFSAARMLSAYEYLTSKGAEVVFSDVSIRLHDKIVVIDSRWVLEGSMNWTRAALEENRESVSLIDSTPYAREKLARIRSIPFTAGLFSETPQEEGKALRIPKNLMTHPKYFPDLLRRKDERIFEFYLWLLKENRVSEKETFVFPDEILFQKFRLDPAKPQKDKRREAVRLLKKLKAGGLIGLSIPAAGADPEITLRLPKQHENIHFYLPLTYFNESYPERLAFAGEFTYLLARSEMAKGQGARWWWRPQEELTGTYHLHHTTLASGMRELQRENLIEILRDDAPEGRPYGERLVNRYRVNRIPESKVQVKLKEKFIRHYGQEKFDQARRYADLIDEPNDYAALAVILQWMRRYRASDLEQAFSQVAAYERNNPRRSIYYLRGILEGMKNAR